MQRRSIALRVRIAAVVSLVVFATSLLGADQMVRQLRAVRVETLQRDLATIARSYDGQFSIGWLTDHGQLQGSLDRLIHVNPGLLRADVNVLRGARPVRIADTWNRRVGDPETVSDVRAILTRRPYSSNTVVGDTPAAELNVPLGPASRPVAALGLDFSLVALDHEYWHRFIWLLIESLMGGLGCSAAVIGLVTWLVFRPLRQLSVAAHAVGVGHTLTRLNWRRRDEMGLLAAEFDRMAASVHERGRLEALALADSLTGLANHRHFHEILESECARAQEDGQELSLIVLDLDHFKRINDEHGHPTGDEVLKAVGLVLTELLRSSDVVARIGGEEFAILLPAASPAAAERVAQLARHTIADLVVEGHLRVTCSAGIATYPTHTVEREALVEYADGALYWAKRAGRNQVRIYDPHEVQTTTSVERRERIRAVLADPQGITPVFQPLVDLSTRTIAGYEALARFPHAVDWPTPDVWIAEAHRCGLGVEVEVRAALAAMAVPRPDGAFLSVNLSPSVAVAPQLHAALPAHMAGIVIELTEHEPIDGNFDALQDAMAEMRRRGARIAVDDAGAGYTGLQQVMKLQPNLVKLDRAIVQGVSEDPARAALIECFVTFARRIGSSVCAEGIEDQADLDALVKLGVTYAQGYLIGHPAPPWTAVRGDVLDLATSA